MPQVRPIRLRKPFLAWAYRFAYLEILKQKERTRRATRHFNRNLIEILAREREQHNPFLEARLQALEQCLDKLPTADQELIRQRYQENTKAEDLVAQLGSSRRTFFRKFERIRQQLFECISSRVAVKGLY